MLLVTRASKEDNMKSNYFIIVFILTFYLTACSQNMATHEVIATYTPVEDSLFRISFEYPSQWTWDHQSSKAEPYESIKYRFVSPNDSRLGGVISVSCAVWDTSELAQSVLNQYLENTLGTYNTIAEPTSLVKQVIPIAGNLDATYIKYEVPPRILSDGIGLEPESGFVISVMFRLENQNYRIGINIDKSLYDQEFIDALDHLLSSIKVIK